MPSSWATQMAPGSNLLLRVDGNLKSSIDAVASGALMEKTIDSAYELLEVMVANNYQWFRKRTMNKKVVGIL